MIPPLITPALGVGTGFVNYWHPTAARAGRSQNFSVGMQRALGRSMSIDVAYVASRGDHLPVRVDINQLDPKYLSLGSLLTRNIRDPLVVAAGYTPPYRRIQRIVGAGPPAVPAVSEHVPRRQEFGYARHVDL